ncbi:MAG: ABC transporter permease [Chitinophagaceae bacterium]|nr:ABC transporter permease [Chitinophagaceae bacterium]
MIRIIRFIVIDILRNRMVLAYAVLLAILSWTVFGTEDSAGKAAITILNVVLLVVPLVSLLFATIYVYNSAEFIELLISQPVRRGHIWISLFIGLSLCLMLAFLFATGIPLLLLADAATAWVLILTGCVISVIFVALAMLAAITSRDKAKGIGVSMLIWLYLALLFDGLVLFLLFQFGDYPIEKPIVLLSAFNPLDLARILNIMQMDASAMMGYTGAIFRNAFGDGPGLVLAFAVLMLWAALPFLWSLYIFKRRDL